MLWKRTSVPAFTARTRPFPRPTAVTLQTHTTLDFAGSDVCAHTYDYIASRTFMKVYQGHVCSKCQEILYKRYLHIYDVVNQCQYHVLNSTCIVLLWIYYGFATLRDWISRWAFVQCIVFVTFLVSDCISRHLTLLLLLLYIVLIFSAWSWFWLSGEHLPGPVSIYIFLIMYICVSLFGSIYTVYTGILVLGRHKVCLFLRCVKFPRNIYVFDKSVFIFEALRIISGINSCRRGILWLCFGNSAVIFAVCFCSLYFFHIHTSGFFSMGTVIHFIC